jgi:hypothetical protein
MSTTCTEHNQVNTPFTPNDGEDPIDTDNFACDGEDGRDEYCDVGNEENDEILDISIPETIISPLLHQLADQQRQSRGHRQQKAKSIFLCQWWVHLSEYLIVTITNCGS